MNVFSKEYGNFCICLQLKVFLSEVDATEVAEYYDYIRVPFDLSTLQRVCSLILFIVNCSAISSIISPKTAFRIWTVGDITLPKHSTLI